MSQHRTAPMPAKLPDGRLNPEYQRWYRKHRPQAYRRWNRSEKGKAAAKKQCMKERAAGRVERHQTKCIACGRVYESKNPEHTLLFRRFKRNNNRCLCIDC